MLHILNYFKNIFNAIFPFWVKNPIPIELKNKIILIWIDIIGSSEAHYIDRSVYLKINKVYKFWHDNVCRRFGYLTLNNTKGIIYHDYFKEITKYFLANKNMEEIKYLIFVSFAFIDGIIRNNDIYNRPNSEKIADDAINYLNELFREYKINLRYYQSNLISTETEFINETAIKPVFTLLADKNFESAENDFITAYDHYEHSRYRDTITYCCCAFESTLKKILKLQNINYKETDNAHLLLDLYIKNNKNLPNFIVKNTNKLKEFLQSLTNLRNEKGPHGHTEKEEIPEYYALYMINMTASTVRFLIEANKANSNK